VSVGLGAGIRVCRITSWTLTEEGILGESANARGRIESDPQGEADNGLHGGPSPLQCFNEETVAALRDSEQGRGMTRFESAEALFEDLGIRHNPDDIIDQTGRLRPRVVERIGREAVAAAVRELKAAGCDVYYTDPAFPGYIIREAPDGSRELLEEDAAGDFGVRSQETR
jgi:hypothetical protein